MRIVVIILLGLALILSLLGTITNRWYQSLSNDFNEGLWLFCQRFSSDLSSSPPTVINHCRRQPYFKSQALAISGIIFLSIAFILSIIYFYQRKITRLLVYLIILLLIASTLLLIFSYLLYPRNPHSRQLGFSIYFMLISSIIVLISTALVTFLTKTVQSTPIPTYLT
ncbi:hypothetical protein I4U23_006083 [Adineta vaga]|nr:hypothetical protein I4U23_006083 [Adineta vaga]